MCSGGGSYTAPKVDPVPTAVTPDDTAASTINKEQRRKRGKSATVLSNDRGTLLSNLTGSDSGNVRKTLG